MPATRKNSFFGGAAILAVGIAIVKVLGALYKIPLGRMLDDAGFGHFNNAYTIYNLLLMVSTAGLPVALSKCIAQANTLGHSRQVRRVFRVAQMAFFLLGLVSFLVMFLFAEPLAQWQGNSMAAPAVRTMSLSCLLVCLLSSYRGFFQGHGNMVPTAVSQVVEALTKLVVGLALTWYLLQLGMGSDIAAAGAIGGVTVSGLTALLVLVFFYRRSVPAEQLSGPPPDSRREILRALLVIAVPITLSASVVPITTYLDTVQVQTRLQDALGFSEQVAVGLYGCYQKAITIYNLPASFMVALTVSVIPAISACLARKDSRGSGQIAESALRVGALFALPAGVGLAVLSGPVIYLLFPETNQEVGGFCMMVLGIASIFVCLVLLCNAILQANDRASLTVWFILIGSALKLAVNYVLVGIPGVGILGAPVGTLLCFFLISVMELIAIRRLSSHPPRYSRVFLKPLLAAGLMGLSVWASRSLFAEWFSPNLGTILSVCVGVVVYVVLVLALRILSPEDLALMPKGEKLAVLLRMKKK